MANENDRLWIAGGRTLELFKAATEERAAAMDQIYDILAELVEAGIKSPSAHYYGGGGRMRFRGSGHFPPTWRRYTSDPKGYMPFAKDHPAHRIRWTTEANVTAALYPDVGCSGGIIAGDVVRFAYVKWHGIDPAGDPDVEVYIVATPIGMDPPPDSTPMLRSDFWLLRERVDAAATGGACAE